MVLAGDHPRIGPDELPHELDVVVLGRLALELEMSREGDALTEDHAVSVQLNIQMRVTLQGVQHLEPRRIAVDQVMRSPSALTSNGPPAMASRYRGAATPGMNPRISASRSTMISPSDDVAISS